MGWRLKTKRYTNLIYKLNSFAYSLCFEDWFNLRSKEKTYGHSKNKQKKTQNKQTKTKKQTSKKTGHLVDIRLVWGIPSSPYEFHLLFTWILCDSLVTLSDFQVSSTWFLFSYFQNIVFKTCLINSYFQYSASSHWLLSNFSRHCTSSLWVL